MNRSLAYFNEWQQIALQVVRGETSLTHSNIVALSDTLGFETMNPAFYPQPDLADGSLKHRKRAALKLSTLLWNMDGEKWLAQEKEWLRDIRAQKGESRDDGKEDTDDVISAEILTRIYSVAYLFYLSKAGKLTGNPDEDQKIRLMALKGLNLFLENAVTKGYSRTLTVDQKEQPKVTSVYGYLANHGIPVGASGLYLPYPEKSFPMIITLLHKEAIREEAYML